MSKVVTSKFLTKEFWKSKNGQITFCVAGGIISLLFLLSQFGVFSGGLMPNTANREKLEKELKKNQQTMAELQEELAFQNEVRKHAESKFNGAWVQSVNGAPEVELRAMLENTARSMDLRFNQLSTVKKVNFSKELELLEIDLDFTTDMNVVMKFLLAVSELKPELYWKRFEVRPANFYGMPAIRFSGSLRCVHDLRTGESKKSAKDSGDKK